MPTNDPSKNPSTSEPEKFVAPSEWKVRCELIRLNPKNKGEYLPLHMDFIRALLDLEEVNFILYFLVGWDLYEFIRPADFSSELVKEMISTHKKFPKETRIVILRKDFHHYQKIISHYRKAKFETAAAGATMVFGPAFKCYEVLSNASQLVIRGAIHSEVYSLVAASVSFSVLHMPATKDVMSFITSIIGKEPTLFDHAALTGFISSAIAWNSLKLSKRESKVCGQAGLMHDVERNCAYLLKPAVPLQISAGAMKELLALRENGTGFHEFVPKTMKQYREKFSGGGYPDSLSGRYEDQGDLGIVRPARIVAIACAITEYLLKRKDKLPLPWHDIVSLMKARIPGEFDPLIWDAFMADLQSGAIRKPNDKVGADQHHHDDAEDADDEDFDFDAM